MRHDTQFALDLVLADPVPLDRALWTESLPDAPLSMPKQVLERKFSFLAWFRMLPALLIVRP